MNIVRYNQIKEMVSQLEQGERSAHPFVLHNMLRELLAEVKVEAMPWKLLPTQLRSRINQLIQQGQKISAIKEYRQATGVGLYEAKLFIENLMENPQKAQQCWNQRVAEFETVKKKQAKPRLRHRPSPKKKKKARAS